MKQPVTVMAPFKLAEGKTEEDLVAASNHFQEAFVSKQPGVLRRELIRTGDGAYMDIVQFRSQEDAEAIIEAEATSEDCHIFFAVMDMTEMSEQVVFNPSLATYN